MRIGQAVLYRGTRATVVAVLVNAIDVVRASGAQFFIKLDDAALEVIEEPEPSMRP